MNHRIVRKLTGRKKLLLTGTGVTAFTVPLVVGMLNVPKLPAQSKTPGSPTQTQDKTGDPAPMPPEAVFEIATIKPSQDVGVHLYLDPSGVFHPTGPSLGDLIKLAYDVHAHQIIGGPSWLDREKYDLFAKPDKHGKPSLAQLKVMLQKLLADRFQLALHREERELSVYAIKVVKSGAKLTRNDSDSNGTPSFGAGPRVVTMTNGTMADLANGLQRSGNILERPVVDQTGLGSARFDLIVKWTPLNAQPRAGAAEPGADNADPTPDLFTAFQQQLGLKLESAKALMEVLVIDHVEKPSEN